MVGSVPCTLAAAKGAMSVPGLVRMAVPIKRLVHSGPIMLHIMSVPGIVCMAALTGRLMPSGRIMSQIMPVPALSLGLKSPWAV
jgi:hypothetical protein